MDITDGGLGEKRKKFCKQEARLDRHQLIERCHFVETSFHYIEPNRTRAEALKLSLYSEQGPTLLSRAPCASSQLLQAVVAEQGY